MGSAGGVQVPDFDRTAPDPKAIRASTIFLCFNQQDSVTDAFGSLLAQTVPLEIVASDDASRDGTFERLYAMAREHRGPHAIRLYRQRRNLGIGANFRFCAGRTTQRYIVLFEGDDWSEPHRVDRLLELARRHPKARMYGSSLRLIGADGMESTWRYVQIERGEIGLSGDWVIRGACFMVDRELIDRFPPIPRRAVAVDLLLNLRALRHFGLESRVVCPEPLVRYRMAERGATRGLQAASGWTELRSRAPRQLGDLVAVLHDDRRSRVQGLGLSCDPSMAATVAEWTATCRQRARQLLAIGSGSRARAAVRVARDAIIDRSNRRMHLGLLRRILRRA